MRDWLERVWFGHATGGALLLPLAALFGAIVRLRRVAYRRGWFASGDAGRPVVVIGNLTVGGSGKTPLTVWLATALVSRGLRVGIASRGYGGRGTLPRAVRPDSDPSEVGDEPLLLARHAPARVVVGRDRLAVARMLAPDVDVIVADDGLQHYRLRRDLEINVIDGVRRYGNGRLLPAGPLREPPERADSVDFTVVNGARSRGGEITMTLVPGAVVALGDGARSALADWAGRRVHALAGIGNPARYFATLRAAGLDVIEHPRADHAPIGPDDLRFGDGLPVLMTEKDAVKCAGIRIDGLFYLEVSARIGAEDARRLVDRIVAIAARSPRT